MWQDNAMTKFDILMTIILWSLIVYFVVGGIGGSVVYNAVHNLTFSILLAVVICGTALTCGINANTKYDGKRLTECEPPVGAMQKLGFILLSIAVHPLFFIYMFTWVKRHFWRKRNCVLYPELRKARKLLCRTLRQPTTDSSKLAVEEATNNYRYLLELISTDEDISLTYIEQAREQRELIELAMHFSDEAKREVNLLDSVTQN